jgi:hypothetical protein
MLALSLSLKVIVFPCPSTVMVLLLLSTLRIWPVKVELLVELAVPDFDVPAAPVLSLELLEFKLLLDVLLCPAPDELLEGEELLLFCA